MCGCEQKGTRSPPFAAFTNVKIFVFEVERSTNVSNFLLSSANPALPIEVMALSWTRSESKHEH